MAFKQPDASDNPLSQEEDEVHEGAIAALRAEVAGGRTLAEASAVLAGIQEDLRDLILDDFLKILIAEEHFSKGQGLEVIALRLGLGVEKVVGICDEMLNEVGLEMASQYRREIAKHSH